jgi:hypothetical protein
MQNFDHNIGVFLKKANYFAENCPKSQKLVIITSTPGANFAITALATATLAF